MPTDPRAAIERLRAASAAVPGSGEWKQASSFDVTCDDCGNEIATCCDVQSTDEYRTASIQTFGMESFAKPTAVYIALMDPRVGAALADLLDEIARDIDFDGWCTGCGWFENAHKTACPYARLIALLWEDDS